MIGNDINDMNNQRKRVCENNENENSNKRIRSNNELNEEYIEKVSNDNCGHSIENRDNKTNNSNDTVNNMNNCDINADKYDNNDKERTLDDTGINIKDLEKLKREKLGNFNEEIGILWHKRLGHPSLGYLMTASKIFPELKNIKFTRNIMNCEACILAKQTRNPCKQVRHKATRPLQIVNSDLMGPLKPRGYNFSAKGGGQYIVSFIDDFSNYAKSYDMKNKTQVHLYLETFIKEMRDELGNLKISELRVIIENDNVENDDIEISKLRVDNGGEYKTKEMDKLLAKENISLTFSEPYTKEHNGRSERFNRSLQEKIRAVMFDCGLPRRFWNYAMRFVVHVYNRSPNKSINFEIPYEKLFKKKAKINMHCVCKNSKK